MVLSVGYTHRQTRRNLGQRNMAVPDERLYPGDDHRADQRRAVTVYNQERRVPGPQRHLFDNEEALDSNYNGGDITLNKRMSDGWSLMAGASFGKSIGDVLGGNLNNPNSLEFRRGLLGNDVPWSYRLSGVYDLPYRIATVSGTMQYYNGVPESTTVSVGSGAVPGGLTQVTQSSSWSRAAPSGFRTCFRSISAWADRSGVGTTSFEPRLDFYNLTNEATVTNWLRRSARPITARARFRQGG